MPGVKNAVSSSLVARVVSATGVVRASKSPMKIRPGAEVRKVTRVLREVGEAQLPVTSSESAFGVVALLPMPRRANASHIALRFAPRKRIRSAAR